MKEAIAALRDFEKASPDIAQPQTSLHRRERKFLLTRHHLIPFLTRLRQTHRLLIVAGHMVQTYSNTYWDTEEFLCYHLHHRGALPRYKIRRRRYLETETGFWEIKWKHHPHSTCKHRHPDTNPLASIVRAHCPLDPETLRPVVEIRFQRIALVSPLLNQRLTLDLHLEVCRCDREARLRFPWIVVECKTPGRAMTSGETRLARLLRQSPIAFSKYYLACGRLYPELPSARLPEHFRTPPTLQA